MAAKGVKSGAWIGGVLGLVMLAVASARGSDRALLFGGDASFAPLEWLDATGQVQGFQPELIRAIARTMELDIEVRLGPWDLIHEEFRAGRIHILGMADQPLRRAYADFTEPHTVIASEMFIRRGSDEFESLEGLAGREVVVQRSALADQWLSEHVPSARLRRVDSEAEALRLLASGSHDAAVVSQFGGRTAIRRHGLTNLTTTGPLVLPSSYALAVAKGETALVEKLNQGLAILKRTGEYNRLYERWFGEVERPAVPLRRVMVIAGWTLGPLLIVTLASLIWSRSLQRTVRRRTAQLEAELENRRRMEARQAGMVAELDHRVRNSLATVLSMSGQMLDRGLSLAQFQERFTQRVAAMAGAHDLLAQARWEGVRLSDAIERTITGVGGDPARVGRHGDDPVLPPPVATPLCMVLDELASNAARHGALTHPDGRIDITCAHSPRGDLRLMWQERVPGLEAAAIEPGFGLGLVRGLIEHQLSGTCTIERAAGGLVCDMRVPAGAIEALRADRGVTPAR